MSGKWTVRPPDTMRHVGEDVAILRKDFEFLDSLLGEAAHQVGLLGLPAWLTPACSNTALLLSHWARTLHSYLNCSFEEAAPKMAGGAGCTAGWGRCLYKRPHSHCAPAQGTLSGLLQEAAHQLVSRVGCNISPLLRWAAQQLLRMHLLTCTVARQANCQPQHCR